ncbi:MAG: 2-octaprenyl-6-methoxyphenol hydroxylase [Alcanivorax sp.]|jgi:2-octaprenyl-6-methoxyphenol hydroxylase
MIEHRDIVIAGGGMVGISLALKLAAVMPADRTITLVEGYPLPSPNTEGRPDYHPSFDARSTALSYSTRLIYDTMGLWSELEQWLCPIDTIHVSTRGRFGSTLLKAYDHDWPALGYVVENAWLGSSLVRALHHQPRIETISPAKVVCAQPDGNKFVLTVEAAVTLELEAALLLVVDGADSGLRKALGMGVAEKSYEQRALVANVAFAGDHAGCAFERFTDEGPLALLPLLGVAGSNNRSSLVWTLPEERCEALLACEHSVFLAELQQRFGYRLGRMLKVGDRNSYPLTLSEASEQVRQSVVVMGNAAHALHPVAGQGYNLAIRDVAVLAAVLSEAAERGEALGDLAVLQRYVQRQQNDQMRTISASDMLPGLFMHPDPLLGLARDMALAGLDIAAPLKREFVRYAAGVAAMGELHG